MKLTVRSEYALLALVYLARRERLGYVSAKTIAQAQKIPHKYLEQTLLMLKRSRHLNSRKGKNGGYKLARPATDIALAEIVRLLDGAIAPILSASRYFYESTPLEKEKPLIRVFKEIRDYASKKLEGTSLADVA